MTLRITIEEVPLGVEARKHTLHTINVSNISKVVRRQKAHVKAGIHYYAVSDGTGKMRYVQHVRDDGALVLARLVLEMITAKGQ